MVNDISGSPQGFDQTNDIATGDVDANNEDHTDDYAYDFNGNMKTDTNKGIEGITYNHLNLPTKILFSGTTNGNISYIYNAIGGKVKKVVEDNVANTTTDYLTGFQYKNTELQFFPHAEGYVHYTKPLATQGGENSALGSFNYVFNYTDHLGNVRLSYARDPLVGNRVKILEENHYYAFGLKHKNYNVERLDFDQFPDTGVELVPIPAVANASYNYKYNGIELQEELGLNMYDMDMRDYDPAIARWVVQDPVIHYEYSPYNAFDNNPVFWADPSGADSTSSQKDMLGRNTHDRWGNFIPFGDRYGSTELSLNNADDTEYYGNGDPKPKKLNAVQKYFDYNNDGKLSGLEISLAVIDVGASIFDIVTIPSGEGAATHFGIIALFKLTTKKAAKGVSVIGPRSTYREFAKKMGANFLDVTDEAWSMRKNVEFLQGVVKRGDDVIFSGKFNPAKLDPKSVLGQEIRYLQRHGYSWTNDFSRMIKK